MQPDQDLKARLQLADEAEVAQLRNMKLGSLRNERSKGLGPPYQKFGKRIFYPIADLQKFLAESTVKPNSARTLIDGKRRAHASGR